MELTESLKKWFGHDSFREGQEDLIRALMSGRDILGVMPTGAGKSVCYQLPALLFPGITLVVSPLIALMKDQVMALKQSGVAAAYINSSLTPGQQQEAIRRAKNGAYKIIYVAPERLQTPAFLDFAVHAPISLLAVDEAHCVSQWGQDFRPSYLKVPDFVRALPNRPPVAAFTATATQQVRRDMIRLLELDQPYTLVTGYNRPNLRFVSVKPTSKPGYLLRYLEEADPDACGIVYCSTRKNVEDVCERLRQGGFSATRYHAGLTDEERRRNQDDFKFDRARIMVATNAFGMGIDKADVRFVIHYNMPRDLESYYQEAGRAGRDGEPARCILLYSGTDVRTIRFFIDKEMEADNGLPADVKAEAARKAEERLKYMTFYSTTPRCLRGFMLQYFGEAAPAKCGNCSNCLMAEEAARQMEQRAAEAKQRAAASARRLAEKPRRRPADVELSAEDEKLLADLYALRKRLASKQKVPAYLVFSDATLREMVQKKPFSTDELLNITGVGEKKAARYGTIFLAAIEEAVRSR